MPRSHLCHSCGLELGRIAPRIEPVYGLPVVPCPRCAVVAVRTTGTVRATARRWRRLVGAGLYGTTNLACIGLIGVITVGVVIAFISSVWEFGLTVPDLATGILDGEHLSDTDGPVYSWWHDLGTMWIVGIICTAAFLGLALGVVLQHLSRLLVSIGWLALSHLAIAVPLIANHYALLSRSAGQPLTVPFSGWDWPSVLDGYLVLWTIFLLTSICLPLRRVSQTVVQRCRRVVLGWLKRSMRAHRRFS